MHIGLAARIAAAALALSPASFAGECLAVGMDGLTARLVNPTGRVSGEIDATGCDIGVYYDQATGRIEDAEIHGARLAGVYVAGDARVGVEATTVRGLGAGATGVVFDGSSGAVADSLIEVRSGRAVLARGRAARVIAIGNRVAGGNRVTTGSIVALEGATLTTRGNRVARSFAPLGDLDADSITVVPVATAATLATASDLIDLLAVNTEY